MAAAAPATSAVSAARTMAAAPAVAPAAVPAVGALAAASAAAERLFLRRRPAAGCSRLRPASSTAALSLRGPTDLSLFLPAARRVARAAANDAQRPSFASDDDQ